MVSDGGDVEGAGGVSPSSGPENSRDFISESWEVGMVVVIGVKGILGGGAVAYEGMNLEAAGYHCGAYLKPPNL